MTRYSGTDCALARLARQMDAAAAPTADELAAIEARALDRVMAKLKRAAGRDDLTAAERHAMDTDADDTAAYMAHRRAHGLPTDDAYFARQKADVTARLKAIRDHHRKERPA